MGEVSMRVPTATTRSTLDLTFLALTSNSPNGLKLATKTGSLPSKRRPLKPVMPPGPRPYSG
jgi:hypothetical protein